MHGQRFDRLARRAARPSRRGVLGGLLAAALPAGADARRKRGTASARSGGTHCQLAVGGWFCWGAPVLLPVPQVVRYHVRYRRIGGVCHEEREEYRCVLCETLISDCDGSDIPRRDADSGCAHIGTTRVPAQEFHCHR